MVLLIKNGTVINPGDKTMTKADVLIKDGTVAEVAPAIKEKADEVYDAKGCYVMPGFIDLHVHLRDPGLEYKEDIQTGGAAALHTEDLRRSLPCRIQNRWQTVRT